MDAKVRVHLRHEIKELQRKLGVTTIMVTHDQEEALSMADRIVVMNHGVIEQVGTPTEVYRYPKTLFVADFIGETNQLPAAITANGKVAVGDTEFLCDKHDLFIGAKAVAVIRPVDIIPHGSGPRSPGSPEVVGAAENLIDANVEDIEFLGAFWRVRLSAKRLGNRILVADFSINAVRRLNIAAGVDMQIELPRERLLIYPREA